jgi:hypothetical protein
VRIESAGAYRTKAVGTRRNKVLALKAREKMYRAHRGFGSLMLFVASFFNSLLAYVAASQLIGTNYSAGHSSEPLRLCVFA